MLRFGGEDGSESRVDFSGPARSGEGHPVEASRAALRRAASFDRRHVARRDQPRHALGQMVKPIMERGELVPDDLVMKMVEERLAQPDCAGGFVFDGFPRTLPQAEQLDRISSAGDSASRS